MAWGWAWASLVKRDRFLLKGKSLMAWVEVDEDKCELFKEARTSGGSW